MPQGARSGQTVATAAGRSGSPYNVAIVCPTETLNYSDINLSCKIAMGARHVPMPDVKILRGVAAFARLSDDELELVAEACDRATFAAGSVLMQQGAIEQHALILLSGTAQVIVTLELGPVPVASLSAGALVGEIGMLCDSPRTATVVADSPCRALILSQTIVGDLAVRSPNFAVTVMQMLAARLEQNVEAITYFKTVARALRDDSFRTEVPAAMAARDDEVGAFARAFADMMKTVREREARLQEEVRELRVEIDQARKVRQVSEITDTPEFKALTERAALLRGRRVNR
jgi:CRP-like cAMP-binding protein